MLGVLTYVIRIQENLYVEENEFNLVTKPFLEGIRLNMGVDAIILSETRFAGSIDQGRAEIVKFSRIVAEDHIEVLETVLNGTTLRSILQYLIHAATCSSTLQSTFPEMEGIELSLHKPTCAISEVRICTWFVSESFSCKRWEEMAAGDYVRVVFDTYFLQQVRVQELLEGASYEFVNLSLTEMAETFLFAYGNESLESDTSGERSTSDSINRFVFVSLLICCFAILISLFMNADKDESDDAGVQEEQLNNDEDLKYLEMGRRGMLQMLASGGLIDET